MAAIPESASAPIPVTAENFARAESDLYFKKLEGRDGFGKFFHYRNPTPVDHQDVIRMNRDTLYSGAVFDLDAGPVTISLPDAGKRFMSMQIINEDEYTPMVVYGKGSYALTRTRLVRGTFWPQSARSWIRTIRRTLMRSIKCRMQSR